MLISRHDGCGYLYIPSKQIDCHPTHLTQLYFTAFYLLGVDSERINIQASSIIISLWEAWFVKVTFCMSLLITFKFFPITTIYIGNGYGIQLILIAYFRFFNPDVCVLWENSTYWYNTIDDSFFYSYIILGCERQRDGQSKVPLYRSASQRTQYLNWCR